MQSLKNVHLEQSLSENYYKLTSNEHQIRDECGVFGIMGHPDAATLTALGLQALQHRGQEAAGIVTVDGDRFYAERRMGLVRDTFTKNSVINRLSGNIATGHVRYSTTGETAMRNVQPLFADMNFGGLSLAHNGNLTNALAIRRKLEKTGAIFQSTTDTETILHLIAQSTKTNVVDKFVDALFQVDGAYALIGSSKDHLIGVRDPLGIRPLVLGRLGESYVLASETCALDIIGAKFIREIENGELVSITSSGIESIKPFPLVNERPCIFEYIYFARPDSLVGGKSIYECRKNFGRELATESHVEADMVIPVPDSGVPAAIGYAEASKTPYELGIIRNHYVGRTFIQPQQSIRSFGVKLKHNANASLIHGKKIILLDDSIVRGTTSVKIVRMMREAGAKEIHFRVAAPPITHPDFYGIDTPDEDQLLASTNTCKEMCDHLEADSLAFLTIQGLYKALGFPGGRNSTNPQFTDHCFTGHYPTTLEDRDGKEVTFQLSFLSSPATTEG